MTWGIDEINAVKTECSDRIYALLKDLETQMNINVTAADYIDMKVDGVTLSPSQQATIDMGRALRVWVTSMRQKSAELIANEDDTYSNDSHWPPYPAGAEQFVSYF